MNLPTNSGDYVIVYWWLRELGSRARAYRAVYVAGAWRFEEGYEDACEERSWRPVDAAPEVITALLTSLAADELVIVAFHEGGKQVARRTLRMRTPPITLFRRPQ